jgi:hypothetical protein
MNFLNHFIPINQMCKMNLRNLVLIPFLLFSSLLFSQQIADTTYNPVITHPEYNRGKGPVVFIDEGHFNFHTKTGRYLPFTRLLEHDGYVVKEYTGKFEKTVLGTGKILVIANALNEINEQNWFLPTPSAFTTEEIKEVREWITNGGSLLLIADHMPFAGAASDLATAFGFRFSNGFALDTLKQGPSIFKLSDGTMIPGKITRGRNNSETVTQIATFTGQAFRIPDDASPILIFNNNYLIFMPDTAWKFNIKTPKLSIRGWSQGAYKKAGKGRIVVFGEAAMFSAQLAGPDKSRIGMNAEVANDNHQLLLNIIHWLDPKFD